jgi:hypothetical protein
LDFKIQLFLYIKTKFLATKDIEEPRLGKLVGGRSHHTTNRRLGALAPRQILSKRAIAALSVEGVDQLLQKGRIANVPKWDLITRKIPDKQRITKHLKGFRLKQLKSFRLSFGKTAMRSKTQGHNGPGANRTENIKGVRELLGHAVRGHFENLMNSSLVKQLKLGKIMVKHYLGNVTENGDTSFIISNYGGESSGDILAQVITPT